MALADSLPPSGADALPPSGADALPEALTGWAPEIARTFVLLGADVVLVVDAQGVVTTAAGSTVVGATNPAASSSPSWVMRTATRTAAVSRSALTSSSDGPRRCW